MNIGVLCNSKLCLPSLQVLLQMGNKLVLGMPEEVAEDHYEIEQFCLHLRIPITKFRKSTLDNDLISWKVQNDLDFIFIITFPYILSANVIASINIDIINYHFAPLPKYKGAQPAFWLIKNGEKKGGVAVHILSEKIDGGDLLHFESYKISKTETYKSYLYNVALLNTKVIQKLMMSFSQKNWKKELKKQDKKVAVYYPKAQLNDIRINWVKMDAEEIERLCRACNPWNKGAMAVFNQQAIKLIEVSVIPILEAKESPGTLVRINKTNRIAISCKNGKYIDITMAYQEDLGYYGNNRLSELGLKEGLRLH